MTPDLDQVRGLIAAIEKLNAEIRRAAAIPTKISHQRAVLRPGHPTAKARQVGCRAPIPRPENGMARAWETLAKYIDHYEEVRAEPTKDAD